MNETNTPQSDVSFQVMPHSNGANYTQTSGGAPTPPSSGHSGSKLPYVIIAIVVLALLGGLAYYFIGFENLMFWKTAKTDIDIPVHQASKLPPKFLSENFGSETCDDNASCGETADPDKDGLSNYQEFISGTKPLNPDSDLDGLADGDELNVYGTMPNNKYTDNRSIAQQNDFNDAASIKNGYDPTTQGVKFTEAKLQSIQSRIAEFTLHEPTMTTLGLNFDGSKVQSNASQ